MKLNENLNGLMDRLIEINLQHLTVYRSEQLPISIPIEEGSHRQLSCVKLISHF